MSKIKVNDKGAAFIPFDSELTGWGVTFEDCEPFEFVIRDGSKPIQLKKGKRLSAGTTLQLDFPQGKPGNVELQVRLRGLHGRGLVNPKGGALLTELQSAAPRTIRTLPKASSE